MISIEDFLTRFNDEPGYFDFARVSPIAQSALEEERALTETLSRARFGSLDSLFDQTDRVQRAVSALTGFEPEQIVFQPNTSSGLLQAMFGLSGKVLVSPAEFPSSPFAAVRAASALGTLEPQWLETDFGGVSAAAIRAQITTDTTAVCLSLVDFRSGRLADLEAIRQVIGDRLLIVDAIQGFGAVDVDYSLADVVSSGGQKWVRAGWGTGFLVLSDRAMGAIKPVLSGFNATDVEPLPLDEVPEPSRSAKAFQWSNPNPIAQARFACALEEIAEVGVAQIEAKIRENTARVISMADEYGIQVSSPRADAERAGIVALEPTPENYTVLIASLHNHGVTATARGNSIRLSAHATTGSESFEMLDSAFKSFSTASRV